MKKAKRVELIRVMSDDYVKSTDLETIHEKAQRMMADENVEVLGVHSTNADRCKCKLIDCHCGLGDSNNQYDSFSDEVAAFEAAESDAVITRGNAKELLEDESYLKRVDKKHLNNGAHRTGTCHQTLLDKATDFKDGVVW